MNIKRSRSKVRHFHHRPQRCRNLLLAVAAVIMFPLAGCGGAASSPPPTAETREEIIVSAAISLKEAFQEVGNEFQRLNPSTQVTFNFASSGELQLQIEQGAPVDIFASASSQQMDLLEQKGLLAPGTRRDFASNAAVLVAPMDGKVPVTSFADLTRPDLKRLSIGNPSSVPAGAYAKQILTTLGLWDAVQPKMIFGENVRQVLTYVETGEVDAGIVYATDAAASKTVRIVEQAPAGSSQPIVYPISVVAASRQQERARALVELVTSPEGQVILSRYGFLTPPK